MIPNYVRHASFRGLARYLVTGRGGRSPERVSWRSYRNIDGDMPWKVAAAICESTVRTSKRRCKAPTLHFMWSPSPSDRPLSQKEWEDIADRTLQTMGLDGHQAIIVEHNDTSFKGKPRPHMHMLVNAVREDGRAWRKQIEKANPKRKSYETAPGDSFWQTRLNMLARELEREYGLEQVDTPITAYWENREWTRARSRKRAETEIDKRTGRLPQIPMSADDVKTLGRQVKPIFLSASSWEDLQRRLNDEAGVCLCPKGQGLILQVSDGRYAKLSALPKLRFEGQARAERPSKSRLAHVFGESWDDYWARAEGHVEARSADLKAATSLTPPGRTYFETQDSPPTTASTESSRPHAALDGYVVQTPQPPAFVQTTDKPFEAQQNLASAEMRDLGRHIETDALPVAQSFAPEDIERFRQRMAASVSAARTWERLDHIARTNGLRLHAGWAMHDGTRYLNIGVLDGLDLKKRTLRYGETYQAYRARSAAASRLQPRPRRDQDYEQER